MSQVDLSDQGLRLIASGKVREIYELDSDSLLFVTTDRISAYDVIIQNAIDQKGAILTVLSKFWFQLLSAKIPKLQTHFISLGLPQSLQRKLSPTLARQLERRSMVVKKLKVLPLESIVRGYISGSAWASYLKDGTINGVQQQENLKESQELKEPIWTPSTKAEMGGKDENISEQEAANIVGIDYANQVKALSLAIYAEARAYAAERGIIIADTKFEFALDESTSPPTVTLVDEVLTPDSSRFWSATDYQVGKSQDSFDKQYLRDWLVKTGQKGKENVIIPDDVVRTTSQRYQDAYRKLTGEQWSID